MPVLDNATLLMNANAIRQERAKLATEISKAKESADNIIRPLENRIDDISKLLQIKSVRDGQVIATVMAGDGVGARPTVQFNPELLSKRNLLAHEVDHLVDRLIVLVGVRTDSLRVFLPPHQPPSATSASSL